ncbi:MAG: hypothetical protein GC181_01435 [Bacteroidetes bacterium]|nr:hypothetical protein [Bacteroidota bacterium]
MLKSAGILFILIHCLTQKCAAIDIYFTIDVDTSTWRNTCHPRIEVSDLSNVDVGDSIISRTWDFGDGYVVEGDNNMQHSYFRNGYFKVKLKIITSSGVKDSLIKQIFFSGPNPEYNVRLFEVSKDSFLMCYGDTVVIDIVKNKPTIEAEYRILWGDNWYKFDPPFVHVYEKTGVYYPVLEMTDETLIGDVTIRCRAYFPDTSHHYGLSPNLKAINVQESPRIEITANPTLADINTPVSLSVTGQIAADSLVWNFDDGFILTSSNVDTFVIHQYKIPGIYNVIITGKYADNKMPSLNCLAVDSIKITVVRDLVDIEDFATHQICVLPNPFISTFRLVGVSPSRVEHVRLYNIFGVELPIIFNQNLEINTFNLIDGMYYLEVSGINWSSKKIVFKH